MSAKTVCAVHGDLYYTYVEVDEDEELDVDVRLAALMRGTCKMLKNSIK